jgi:hypothetical protein
LVGVGRSSRQDGAMKCPAPLASKLVLLERGLAAKELRTRIRLGGETNGQGLCLRGGKPEGPGGCRSRLHS